ncbi:redoxin domain-containing protein [Cytobacillus oceanisediminis]|uniref:redoxin domain-containing protein n=2 Tax=Cytobacillus oceanisediminis TaxID=665099 RepID=UPI003736D965
MGKKLRILHCRIRLGKKMSLYDELEKGPFVLTFYRGGWCPFCTLKLRTYQRFLPLFQRLGAQLIAITPRSPDNSVFQ